jgi:hypothetical protein
MGMLPSDEGYKNVAIAEDASCRPQSSSASSRNAISLGMFSLLGWPGSISGGWRRLFCGADKRRAVTIPCTASITRSVTLRPLGLGLGPQSAVKLVFEIDRGLNVIQLIPRPSNLCLDLV